jgi:hypothetical protein
MPRSAITKLLVNSTMTSSIAYLADLRDRVAAILKEKLDRLSQTACA